MKSPFSKAAAALCALLLATSAWAVDYKSVEPAAAILYDSPSDKGKKLYLLRRYTPVEVLVSVQGFIKVREPDGAIGWVDRAALSDRRHVMVLDPKAQIRKAPNLDAPVAFEAEMGVALEMLGPPKDGWVSVKHLDGDTGSVRVTQVWGL